MQDEETLLAHYKKYFRTVNASTQTLKDEAYRLRYEVYKHEQIISAEIIDNEEMEFDQFDDSAMHSLLLHKKTSRAIGYIRLVPYRDGGTSVKHLPIENYCENISLEQARTDKTGEISRMLVHPHFRRRRSDEENQLITDDSDDTDARRFSINYLPMCITLAGLNLMVLANIECAAALMERSLAIQLRRQGVFFIQIGEPIELFGHRIPFLIDTEKTCKGIKAKKPEFYELFDLISSEYSTQL